MVRLRLEKTGRNATEARRQYRREWMRRWRLANPGVDAERARAYRRRHPERSIESVMRCIARRMAEDPVAEKERQRRWRIRYRYRLTGEEYTAILEHQQYACAVCSRSFEEREPCIDHCHKSKEVRGILCNYCNWNLVRDERRLRKGIAPKTDYQRRQRQYLESPPAFAVIGRRKIA